MTRYGADLLRIDAPLNTRIDHCDPFGGVEGIVLLDAAWRRNADHAGAVGALRIEADGDASYRAPWSATFGTAVDVSAGGTFILTDGDNPDLWLRVSVTAADLPTVRRESPISLSELYNNAVASSDLTAASAEDSTWDLILRNTGAASLLSLTAWLDPDTPDNDLLEIKFGAGSYASPKSETAALAAFTGQTILAAGTLTLTVHRVEASPAVDPRRPVTLHVSWDDNESGRAKVTIHGCYRVRGSAVYSAYTGDGSNPDTVSGTAYATFASLPATPATTFGDGDHRFAVTLTNPYGIEGPAKRVSSSRRHYVVSGTETTPPPDAPDRVWIRQLPGGIPELNARVFRPPHDRQAPTSLSAWVTTDGSAPGSGDPTYTPTVNWNSGVFLWRQRLAAQIDATVVKVLAKTKRGSTLSTNTTVVQSTISLTGPDVPL